MRNVALSLSLLVVGCSGPSAATHGAPPVLPPDTLSAVCALEPCGGPSAMVTVYRDASGAVARLHRLYGECDHSPAIYLSPEGTVLDMIPEQPVTPGSPEAEAFRVRIEGWTAGLTATDLLRCRDGARLDPL